MTRSKAEEEVDVADQFLNYDGEVTTVEAEGTSVDNAEQNTSTTNKTQEQETDTSKGENPNEDPSNEKENEDPKESAAQDQAKSIEKSDKEDDESGEVYEVEKVLDHNRRRNKTYYLIKWKGYSEEESTWEAEDNVFAEELVKDYWANNSEEAKQKETRKGRKRGAAAPPPTPIKKETKKARTSITPKKAKVARSKIDEEFDHDEDWESSVSGVETVTRDDKTGELLVYLKWKNGDPSRHPAKEANIKCPQKMIKFYEQRLTFAAPQPKS
ncbi:hypothetical protein RirG_092780 [Rhizophagus irregularis DAOM 197198w]|uniref:Chromo domain-containing protein n=1 Tax=Rhizophagus irregularis (strain DAOM 197198w) TaxID=1432141 RepID=A0A015JR81_RHIIW|nr:hypothetical protein RirG_092780 [Rhizophagus irregularis DAOM 197198w]EXX69804.1 hypothetical protein RirG_092780 [Rhizophagus irregularis DAOM 197198w]EXX69805.1 hypothetical protein RirG_092780 [Rhizophagus irregularis DAOM 197198w]EXX69806.1 hypothetical protein RirG_092780 [Rhizophagus irregularis DAOM 197198w]